MIQAMKEQNIAAMKAKDSVAKGILTILLSEIKNAEIDRRFKGLDLTQAEKVAIIQKTIKELSESKDAFVAAGNQEKVDSLTRQIAICRSFLPAMLTEEEIRTIIASLPEKTIPAIMKHFKSEHAGKCDMALVSKIANQMI